MESRVEDRSPDKQPVDDLPESEERWAGILQRVVDEQPSDPWYVKLGTSLVWAAGIALAAGIATALVLGLRALLSAKVEYTFRNLSDHIFWAAALLMIVGMFSPSATELDRARDKKKRTERPRSAEERRSRAMERRLRRVYDPWRWRVWGGAALTFGLAILTGMFS